MTMAEALREVFIQPVGVRTTRKPPLEPHTEEPFKHYAYIDGRSVPDWPLDAFVTAKHPLT